MDKITHQGRPNTTTGSGATEMFVNTVTTNKIPAFRAWLKKLHQLETTFPGFKKSYVQIPQDDKENSWMTLLQFDTEANLDKWLQSSERAGLLKAADEFVASQQMHKLSGVFDGWFLENELANPPPLWKQSMLLIVALFPPMMLESIYLLPHMSSVNPVVAKFISLMITVSVTSLFLMPLSVYLLRWWLQADSKLKNFLGIVTISVLYLLELGVFMMLSKG